MKTCATLLVAMAASAVLADTTNTAIKVESRKNSDKPWATYEAVTIDRIAGFAPTPDATDEYGGWADTGDGKGTGFFTTRKVNGRWWMVDPLGNLFLSKGVATVVPGGGSRRKREALKQRFGSVTNWYASETAFLCDAGFNTLGGWSHALKPGCFPKRRIPYTLIASPMAAFNRDRKKAGQAPNVTGYPKDFPPVFVKGFDEVVERELAKFGERANDPYLIGYFIDNEIPWRNHALETCLRKFPEKHPNRKVARAWLDQRKGVKDCPIDRITDADRRAFVAFALETYLRKVTAVLRRIDPNHLFLGCRFNRFDGELGNEEAFKVAGRYMDIISINHYTKWQPDQEQMKRWERWAGKPFMVTEFYTKGEDSGLPNRTGAGWNVRTQNDRGIFYENFVNELAKSRVCVGWHWFKYMDNDPEDLTTDPSNRDSNKGIVRIDFTRYDDLLKHMRAVNACAYGLTRFHDQ